jgi:hypothetical protein
MRKVRNEMVVYEDGELHERDGAKSQQSTIEEYAAG